VLLTYAEAQNEIAGPSDDIFNALDKIRDRVGMARINRDLNKDELRKEIRHERRVEFAGEGLYYFDIRRWKIASQVLNTEIYHLNGNRIDSRAFRENRDYLWPIPSLAIQNNDQLIQNPNYGN